MTEDVLDSTAPHGPRSDRGRLVLAALAGGLSVVLLGAGAVAVSGLASADTPTPTPTETSDTAPARPGMGGMLGGMGGMLGGMLGGPGAMGMLGHLGGALHGSVVVADDDGGYLTYEAQRGEVTAVGTTSVSVRSEDGYEHTYAVTDETVVHGGDPADSAGTAEITDLAVGDEVGVIARLDGATSTAMHVIDLDSLQQRLEQFGKRLAERADGGRSWLPRMPWFPGHPGGSGDGSGSGSGNGS